MILAELTVHRSVAVVSGQGNSMFKDSLSHPFTSDSPDWMSVGQTPSAAHQSSSVRSSARDHSSHSKRHPSTSSSTGKAVALAQSSAASAVNVASASSAAAYAHLGSASLAPTAHTHQAHLSSSLMGHYGGSGTGPQTPSNSAQHTQLSPVKKRVKENTPPKYHLAPTSVAAPSTGNTTHMNMGAQAAPATVKWHPTETNIQAPAAHSQSSTHSSATHGQATTQAAMGTAGGRTIVIRDSPSPSRAVSVITISSDSDDEAPNTQNRFVWAWVLDGFSYYGGFV